jgi:phosphatidylglycerophosphate synthase
VADDLDSEVMIGSHTKSLSESVVDGESRSPQGWRTALGAQIANALSLTRFALAAAWIVCARAGERRALLAITLIAIASDFFDGRLARRLNAESAAGRWLDGIADVAFILTAMVGEVIAERLPIYVPVLVTLLFAQYAADSAWRSGRPIASRIGHWCGIVNYALVLLLSSGWGRASAVAIRLSPILAAFYTIAMAERIWLYYEPRS